MAASPFTSASLFDCLDDGLDNGLDNEIDAFFDGERADAMSAIDQLIADTSSSPFSFPLPEPEPEVELAEKEPAVPEPAEPEPVAEPARVVIHQFQQFNVVATGKLQVTDETQPVVDRTVRGLEQYVKQHEGDGVVNPQSLGKSKRTTKKNTQAYLELPDLSVNDIPITVVVRTQDYTTAANHKRSNFKNQVTLRYGTTKGPSLKLFRNGALQGAGFTCSQQFAEIVNAVADYMDLPPIDPAATKLSLVNGSGRVMDMSVGTLDMGAFRDGMNEKGFNVHWDPNTGNNGANVKIPDVDGERSAMVFSNGYVKLFAKSEEQLVRIFDRLNVMMAQVL